MTCQIRKCDGCKNPVHENMFTWGKTCLHIDILVVIQNNVDNGFLTGIYKCIALHATTDNCFMRSQRYFGSSLVYVGRVEVWTESGTLWWEIQWPSILTVFLYRYRPCLAYLVENQTRNPMVRGSRPTESGKCFLGWLMLDIALSLVL